MAGAAGLDWKRKLQEQKAAPKDVMVNKVPSPHRTQFYPVAWCCLTPFAWLKRRVWVSDGRWSG